MKRLALALYCTLIAYCNVQAVTLDPASIRERQRFETMTLYVCGTPGFKYPGEIYIENNRTHQIALLYSGDNCGMPTVSADERWIIIADGMRMMGAVHML